MGTTHGGKVLYTKDSKAEGAGKDKPFRYRGYVYDEETQLYYLRSRYHDPEWGRFLNADSVLGSGGLLSHNLLAYCGNHPIIRDDKTGKAWYNEVGNGLPQKHRMLGTGPFK